MMVIDRRTSRATVSRGRRVRRGRRLLATTVLRGARDGRPSPGGRGDEDLLQRLELLEALATADGHAVEGVAGNHDGHARFVLEPGVETVQQGAAPGEHDALFHDVGGQL